MTVKSLIDEMKKLTREERAELMDELILMDVREERDLTPSQAADLRRRIDDYKAGKTRFTPGEAAVERVRNRHDA